MNKKKVINMANAKKDKINVLSSNSQQLYTYIIDEFGIDDDASKDLLCESLLARDRLRQIRQKIEELGIVLSDRWGSPKANPLLSYEKDMRAQYFNGMKQLNLDVGIGEE